MHRASRIAVLLSTANFIACYSPDYGSGGFLCGDEQSCPTGLTCANGQCLRDGLTGEEQGTIRVVVRVADSEPCDGTALGDPAQSDCEGTLIVMASVDIAPGQDDQNTTINLINLRDNPKIVDIGDLDPGEYNVLVALYEEGFTKWNLSPYDLRGSSDGTVRVTAGAVEEVSIELERGPGAAPP